MVSSSLAAPGSHSLDKNTSGALNVRETPALRASACGVLCCRRMAGSVFCGGSGGKELSVRNEFAARCAR
jgi:hypothetical protein